jgi:hypothetical protein
MTAASTTPEDSSSRAPWLLISLAVGFFVILMVFAVSADDDAPTSGPVTIETEIDFTGQDPGGPFEVTEGADVLGCTAGTFTDPDATDEGILKVLSCESGSKEGTFSILFRLGEPSPDDGSQSGPWNVSTATADFVGLQGEGDMSVV